MKNPKGLFLFILFGVFINTNASEYNRFSCSKNPLLAFNAATVQEKYHKNCIEAALKTAEKVKASLRTNTPLKGVNTNFANIFKGWSPQVQDAYLVVLKTRLDMGLAGLPVVGENVDTFNQATHLSVGSNIKSDQCASSVLEVVKATLAAHPNMNCLKKAYGQITKTSKSIPSFSFVWDLLSEDVKNHIKNLIEGRLGMNVSPTSSKSISQLTPDIKNILNNKKNTDHQILKLYQIEDQGQFTPKNCANDFVTAVASLLNPNPSVSCWKAIQKDLNTDGSYLSNKFNRGGQFKAYDKYFQNLLNKRLDAQTPDLLAVEYAIILFRFLVSVPKDPSIKQADRETYGIDKPCPKAYRSLRFSPSTALKFQVQQCFDACQEKDAQGDAEKKDFANYNRACFQIYQLALGNKEEATENMTKDGYALSQTDQSIHLPVYMKVVN